MKKNLSKKLELENKFVTKCILKGMTISQIAQKLDCSTSTVSNRIKKIFKQYQAKSRSEFILNVLAEVIKKDRLELRKQENELAEYYSILRKIQKLKDDKTKLQNYVLTLGDFDYLL